MTSLRTIKKEIRVLGLDTCRNGAIIVAVVRGGFFLDGVMRLQGPKPPSTVTVARLVKESRYYPELRVIMTHDEKHVLELRSLEESVGLPVLQATTGTMRGYRKYRTRRGAISIKAQLEAETVAKIVSLTWTRGKMPEPLRIAHLIAKSKLPTLG